MVHVAKVGEWSHPDGKRQKSEGGGPCANLARTQSQRTIKMRERCRLKKGINPQRGGRRERIEEKKYDVKAKKGKIEWALKGEGGILVHRVKLKKEGQGGKKVQSVVSLATTLHGKNWGKGGGGFAGKTILKKAIDCGLLWIDWRKKGLSKERKND